MMVSLQGVNSPSLRVQLAHLARCWYICNNIRLMFPPVCIIDKIAKPVKDECALGT